MIKYFLYRINRVNAENANAEIYGKFESLSAAKLSAELLMIQESSFILSSDMKKIYFYEKSNKWEYNILTEKDKIGFLNCFPDPRGYKI